MVRPYSSLTTRNSKSCEETIMSDFTHIFKFEFHIGFNIIKRNHHDGNNPLKNIDNINLQI